jgi:polyisoprenoid-binding protein YceI
MKTLKQILTVVMVVGIGGVILQCQHNDSEIIPIKGPDPIQRGTQTVSCTDCTPANFDAGPVSAGTWYFDKAHSNVGWETQYRLLGSPLTGRFDYFSMKSLTFSEANPSTIAFEGSVRLNSVNTGEPGRDDSCLLTTYGTDGAKTDEEVNAATIVTVAGTGRYSSTDEGYFVDANLTFHGFTKKVVVKLYYYPLSDQGTYNMVGFSAEFEILSKTDFGIVSANIDDKVVIKVNANLKNKKS